MDLIREMLFRIEERDDLPMLDMAKPDDCNVYHAIMLREAGLISGYVVDECDGGQWVVQQVGRPRLTWTIGPIPFSAPL
jgi:hypothetical protein